MGKHFCDFEESIQELCGSSNPTPPCDSPAGGEMTCVFQVQDPTSGLTTQSIFVGRCDDISTYIEGYDITGILNVAYDVNDSSDLVQQTNAGEQLAEFNLQLAKVGLIDGPENDMMTVISAVYVANELLTWPSESQQKKDGMVNLFPPGNLLIHCHDGGSRSVTVAALFIWFAFFAGAGTKTFKDVYSGVICDRWNHAWNHHPTKGICKTAFDIVDAYSTLFPALVPTS